MRGLLPLVAAGTVLEIGLVMLNVLTYQLSQQISFTDLFLERYPLLQTILTPLLAVGAPVVPEIVSPRASGEFGAWFMPLARVWVLACAVTSVGYLAALWSLHRGMPGARQMRVIIGAAFVFAVTAFAAPGLLSQDIFSFLMYGQIAQSHGLNPYIWPPNAFVHDPLLRWVAPIWRSMPSPYGPVWTDVNWAVATLARNWSIIDKVLAYRTIALVLYVVTLWVLWRLLKHVQPEQPERTRVIAFAAFAWNPLVLVESVGNAHPDILALVLLLAALLTIAAPERSRGIDPRLWVAVVLLALSALVKYISAPAGLFLVIVWIRSVAVWQQRARHVAVVCIVAIATTIVLFAPWLELPDSLDPLVRETAGDLYTNAVPDLVSRAISVRVLVPMTAPSDALASTRHWMKTIIELGFAVYVVWEIRRLWIAAATTPGDRLQQCVGAASRVTLVLILVVSNWVEPWYFVLPLGLSVLLGVGRTITRVAIGFTLTSLGALYVHYYLQDATPALLYVAYAGLPLVLGVLSVHRGPTRQLASACHRWRSHAGLETEPRVSSTT